MKILIADAMSDKAVDILKQNHQDVDVKTDLTKDQLKEIIGDYDALIVRSAAKVTKDIIEKADKLKIIGRAGIGVDNVDVEAATQKGIVVMNTPQGNALAAAEHAIALMFALARKVALADRTMKEGKWEKKLLMGVEIQDKTMGIIGIGNIGMIVAEKALALGMKVVAYDLFVSHELAESKGIELVSLDMLLSRSDFISIHVPLLKETRGLLNKDAFSRMKKGVFIINTSRGPVIEDKDLFDALESGQVAGAALDVFEPEPPPKDYFLVLSDKVIATPHLGASTKEAQSKVAIDIANQITDYALNGVIKNSVNAPPASIDVQKQLAPYLELSEKLAKLVSYISEAPIQEVAIEYKGEIAEVETKILTQGIIKAILSPHLEGVNYVNAPSIAKERGIKIKETKEKAHEDFNTLLGIQLKGKGGENVAYGTLLGKKEPRLIKVNKIAVDADLAGNILFMHTYDKPGVIGDSTTLLAKKGFNIAGMHFGRESVGGLSISLVDVDDYVTDDVIKELRALPNIIDIKRIDLS
jgi:D-3-phosphoglycerate dehydrogenase / 2-oxoglutarate reductase